MTLRYFILFILNNCTLEKKLHFKMYDNFLLYSVLLVNALNHTQKHENKQV